MFCSFGMLEPQIYPQMKNNVLSAVVIFVAVVACTALFNVGMGAGSGITRRFFGDSNASSSVSASNVAFTTSKHNSGGGAKSAKAKATKSATTKSSKTLPTTSTSTTSTAGTTTAVSVICII